MKKNTLFRRDFTLMVIGQIISLFANSILRFSLSLYVLDISGSAAVFGSILAVSMIPTILLSPIGGIIADRVNRRNIMVCLDFLTSALCIGFALFLKGDETVFIIAIVMVILAIIQSFYQPSVQASIPVLADEEHLLQANGVVVQVNALANFLGPILGGVLYGFFALEPIVMISAAAFFLSAVMEIFIHIPFTRIKRNESMMKGALIDLKSAARFISKDNPVLFKILLIVAALNLFFSSMIMIGLPYIVKIELSLSSQLYGIAESIMAIGSIAAGLSVSYFSKKYTIQQSYRFIILGGIAVLPIALTLWYSGSNMLSYVITCICIFACMSSVGIFSIYAQTFLQRETPNEMMGKVASFVSTIVMCSLPIGQSLYGMLYDMMSHQIYVVILAGAVIELMLAFLTKRYLMRLTSTKQ